MTREMLINTAEDQECRIAVMSNGRLEELYVERASIASHVGNIYKGRVTNVESAIQAAFVDFGLAKNGFLHISDIHPQYFPQGRNETEAVGRKRSHRERPPIQQCLRRGQEVVVQMTKEGIGTKGPTLTTYLSIPGRLLVMMPGMSRLGVSRKIEEDDLRQKARSILAEITVPDDMGFIVRTAGADRSKRDLQRDLNYLLRLWKSVSEQIKRVKAPAEIYEESDLVTRTIRDIYSSDITRVICDDEADVRRVKELLSVALPRGKNVVELYDGKEGLFHRHGLEAEIEKIYSHRVELASGGSIVIDQTEALVAIDVNSGRFRKHSDAETTALKINQEAAGEIARQLSLRDLGGVIIIDFIDMREERNRRAVERSLRTAIRSDRAKTKVLRISNFGIVEMTRQRLGPSLKSNMYHSCRACAGTGVIKSEESQALSIMRSLRNVCADDDVARVNVHVTPPVAHHLANYHRRQISELEAETEKTIIVEADTMIRGDEVRISCTNARGTAVAEIAKPSPRPSRRGGRSAGRDRDRAPSTTAKSDSSDAGTGAGNADGPSPADAETPEKPPAAKKSRKRSRRRGRKTEGPSAGQASDATPKESAEAPDATDAAQAAEPESGQADQPKEAKKTRSRSRRGSRRRRSTAEKPNGAEEPPQDSPPAPDAGEQAPVSSQKNATGDEPPAPKKRRTRRGRRRSAAKKEDGSDTKEPVKE